MLCVRINDSRLPVDDGVGRRRNGGLPRSHDIVWNSPAVVWRCNGLATCRAANPVANRRTRGTGALEIAHRGMDRARDRNYYALHKGAVPDYWGSQMAE